jgi:hypothetical protein
MERGSHVLRVNVPPDPPGTAPTSKNLARSALLVALTCTFTTMIYILAILTGRPHPTNNFLPTSQHAQTPSALSQSDQSTSPETLEGILEDSSSDLEAANPSSWYDR